MQGHTIQVASFLHTAVLYLFLQLQPRLSSGQQRGPAKGRLEVKEEGEEEHREGQVRRHESLRDMLR